MKLQKESRHEGTWAQAGGPNYRSETGTQGPGDGRQPWQHKEVDGWKPNGMEPECHPLATERPWQHEGVAGWGPKGMEGWYPPVPGTFGGLRRFDGNDQRFEAWNDPMTLGTLEPMEDNADLRMGTAAPEQGTATMAKK